MRRGPVSFEAAVRAFRDATAVAGDGAATRARVLARAGRRRDPPRALVVAAALFVMVSASAALTATARARRPLTSIALSEPGPLRGLRALGDRPVRVIPAAQATEPPLPARAAAGGEDGAYRRAHRAHFVDDVPARALTAWNAYLGAYPAGVFAPEARFNRALCLVRLGRLPEAARALRTFARAAPSSYRREEALILLQWIADH